jgi:hypothetical protein
MKQILSVFAKIIILFYLFNFSGDDCDLIAQFVVFDEMLTVHGDTAGLNAVHLSGSRLDRKEGKDTYKKRVKGGRKEEKVGEKEG